MPNLDALDTAIAVVIVLLLLSLIVQSVQAIFKKLLKIKSRQLEQSLVDLFEHIIASPAATGAGTSLANKAATKMRKSPILQLLTPRGKHASELAGKDVQELYQAVITRFKEIGRVSVAGKAMLDSISKEDLLKVLRSVAPGSLLPNLVTELTAACDRVAALDKALKIDVSHLDGEASAKFAAMHDALAPMLSDIRSIMSGAQLNPKLLLGDVMGLRQIKLDEVLKLLGEVQKKVEEDIRGESAAPDSQRAKDLKAVADGLKTVAATMIELRQKFDAALAPMRVKLSEVESWYDTVMQSFEERYARSMKTWAVVISFIVVIFLNANFFNIYKNISANDVTRSLIVQAGPQILKGGEAQTIAQNQATEQTSDTQTSKELLDSIQSIRSQLRSDVDTYASLGFAPTKWADFRAWLSTWKAVDAKDQTGAVIAKGSDVWLNQRKADLRTLLGWIITALLLSVGAPFWQDTLESLFGIKSLLRKRGDIRNVETASGAGQPKT